MKNIKIIPVLFILLFLSASNKIFSQYVNYFPDTSKFCYSKPFNTLNPEYISTGILHNRVINYSQIERFQGKTTDSILDYKNWFQIFWELYNADIKTNKTLPDAFKLKKDIQEKIDKGIITVGIINMQYNSIKEDAVKNGQLKIENYYLKDIIPHNVTPYDKKQCFAISVLTENLYCNINYSFVFDKNYYFTNTDDKITSINADFGDALGYRKITFNNLFFVNYAIPGEKTITCKILTDKLNIYYSKLCILVEQLKEDYIYQEPDFYHEVSLGGQLGIYYHHCYPGQPILDPVIRKPIFIVKGYDPQNKKNFSKDLKFHNTIDATDLYDIANTDYHILDKLRAEGFDIIILNHGDAKRNLYENASVVEESINWINNTKEGNEELVIIGPSMGGLLTRYVLAKMEHENHPHHTRLWISFDAPHQGANMPLGFQHLIDFVLQHANLYTFYSWEKIEEFRNQMDCDAAKQMLYYHHSATEKIPMDANPSPLKVEFYNNLKSLNPPYNGYPNLCRKIAMIDGSGNGLDQGFDDNDVLLLANLRTPWAKLAPSFWIRLEVHALPDNHTHWFEWRRLFYGEMWISYAPGIPYIPCGFPQIINIDNAWGYDDCPGGNYPFHIMFNKYIMLDGVPWGPQYFELNHNDCFMPITTTLDLNNGGYININILNGGPNIVKNLPNCPFEEVYIPNENEPHVVTGITAGMAEWLISQINPESVYIQNRTFSSKHKYSSRYFIWAGNNVDNNQPPGDVSLLPGSELYLHAGELLLIDDGFYADENSTFYGYWEPYPCIPLMNMKSNSFVSNYNFQNEDFTDIPYFDSTKIEKEKPSLTLWPNPANVRVNIILKGNENNEFNIVIYNMIGEKVMIKEKQIYPFEEIDVSRLKDGIYFIKLYNSETELTKKIIIQR